MRSDTQDRPSQVEDTQQLTPVDQIPAGPTLPGAVDSTEVDGTEARRAGAVYPDQDPDQAGDERPRSKTFSEAMADAHQTLMQMTGNLAAAWEEMTDGMHRTVSIVPPRPDEGSDGRTWSGQVWRVVLDANDAVAAAWDGYSDPEGFAAALIAAHRKSLELKAARKRSATSIRRG